LLGSEIAGRFERGNSSGWLLPQGRRADIRLPRPAHEFETVSALLRPGGRPVLREGHAMMWSLCDPRPDGLVVVDYPYFETPAGTTFVSTKTSVEHEGELASPTSITYNHALGEIVTALLNAGLVLAAFSERQSAPWDFLPGATVADERGEHQLREHPERLAATYTVVATKP
jgi:hypothetical protein